MIEEYDEIKGVFGRSRMTPHGFGPSLEELLLEHPRGRHLASAQRPHRLGRDQARVR